MVQHLRENVYNKTSLNMCAVNRHIEFLIFQNFNIPLKTFCSSNISTIF